MKQLYIITKLHNKTENNIVIYNTAIYRYKMT